MTTRAAWCWGLVGLVVVVGLPLAGRWARPRALSGCALDGTRIDPAYRVEITDDHGQAHSFCCLRCAEWWLQRHGAPVRAITVTDEVSGQPIDAAAAIYVRSRVVTMPATGNRIHVFRTLDDAHKHADSKGGTILSGPERPFAR